MPFCASVIFTSALLVVATSAATAKATRALIRVLIPNERLIVHIFVVVVAAAAATSTILTTFGRPRIATFRI